MNIFCVGRNYVDHAKELNNPVPDKPVIFSKPTTALLVNGKPFYYPNFSKNIQFEAELVIRISNKGKKIGEKYALKYFDQVTLGIDLTARDIQNELKQKGLPWEIAKGFDGSAVLGTWTDIAGLKNPDAISFKLLQNGKVVQYGVSTDMLFSFNALITYISQFFTLQTGDIIFTGTPAGVGPINIGDRYTGYVEEKQLLNFTIK